MSINEVTEIDYYMTFYSGLLNIPWISAKFGTALLRVHHDITMDMDCNYAVILVLLDMSAAFDTIETAQLLATLGVCFGINATALKWIDRESFMTTRFFSVHVAGESPVWRELLSGVPQGSVLGPLLFSAYTTPMLKGQIYKHFMLANVVLH